MDIKFLIGLVIIPAVVMMSGFVANFGGHLVAMPLALTSYNAITKTGSISSLAYDNSRSEDTLPLDTLFVQLQTSAMTGDETAFRNKLRIFISEYWRTVSEDSLKKIRYTKNLKALMAIRPDFSVSREQDYYTTLLRLFLSGWKSKNHKKLQEYIDRLDEAFNSDQDLHNNAPFIRRLGRVFEDHKPREYAKQFYLISLDYFEKDQMELKSLTLSDLGHIYYYQSEYLTSAEYFGLAASLAGEIGHKSQEAANLNNYGQIQKKLGNYTEAITSRLKALEIYHAMDDTVGQSITINSLGIIYASRGLFEEGLDYFLQSLSLARSIEDSSRISFALSNIGSIHFDMKNYEKALAYYNECLEIRRLQDNARNLAATIEKLGNCYSGLGNYDLAENYLLESLDIKRAEKNQAEMISGLVGIGELYLAKEDPDKAESFLREAYAIAGRLEFPAGLTDATFELGNLESYKGNIRTAIKYWQEAYTMANLLERDRQLLEITANLSREYAKLGQFEVAFRYEKENRKIHERIFNLETARKIDSRDTKLKLQQKEAEKELLSKAIDNATLNNQLARQRWTMIVTFSLVLFVVALIAFWRARVEIARKNLFIQKKQELENMKTRFFVNVSHELRTPISLIKGPLTDLDANHDLDDKSYEKLKTALKYSDKLEKLNNEILELSKLESDAVQVKPEPVMIEHEIRRILGAFESAAKAKSIDYELSISFPPNLCLEIDPVMLEKILNNLIGNALKYTDQGGHVKAVCTDQADQKVVKFMVQDDGRGIRQEDIDYIFDRYYQVSSQDTPIEGGLGIGLAMVRELVDLLKGSIEVKSEMGIGSSFTVILPRKIATPEEPYQQAKPADYWIEEGYSEADAKLSKESVCVLIVEDNPDMRKYIENIVLPYYRFISVENGEKAWVALQDENSKIDLVITDIMMPKMDGFTLLEMVKADADLSDMPIIVLTARAQFDDKIRALTIGVDDYMSKPFDSSELLARCRNLLKFKLNRLKSREANNDVMDSPEEQMTANQRFMNQIDNLLRSELGNSGYLMENLAEEMKISYRTLHRRIKNISGLNPNGYFRELRLVEAHDMLISGKYRSVSEVSFAVGFDNPGYFTKIYYQRFGKKPSQYLYESVD
ncbi:MAG: tetratricopeptide repeat protein [Reichenbachiella sp.]|uniref:tetratricopeptide repeat protein n=2 Tax=Reichenbachiella sp. TaxID=2184521 RepID=UPI003263C500